MKAFFFALCFALFASSACLAQSNIGGRYHVLGTNANWSSYSGTAEISITSTHTCRITWVTGGTTSSGICMRNNTAFSAGYRLGEKIGLVIYQIKTDGSMEGLWTVADQTGVGTERLVPIR